MCQQILEKLFTAYEPGNPGILLLREPAPPPPPRYEPPPPPPPAIYSIFADLLTTKEVGPGVVKT